MASKDYPDPIADFFKRNRVKFAVVIFVVIMLGRIPGLFDGTAGIVNFAYGAAFFGLLSWSWASRQDRNEASYYLKFGTLWTILLAVQVGMILVSLARGNDFQGRWMIGLVFVGLFVLMNLVPYFRIKSGKPWPPQPKVAAN